MTLKRIYNLKNQRITQYHDDLPKTCVCVLLILFVICGLILAGVFIAKNGKAATNEAHGQLNQDRINTETSQSNTKNDFFVTSTEGDIVTKSNTVEYSSTTIESSMSPKNVPHRFLIVSTVSAVGTSSSDYSAAGSTNDYIKITESGIGRSSAEKRSTVRAVGTSSSDYSTEGSTNDYVKMTESGIDTSSLMKRSTSVDFMTVSSVETSSSDYSTASSTNDYVKITETGIDTSSAVKQSTVADVMTVGTVEVSSPDYSTSGSTNDYVTIVTESRIDTSSAVELSTVKDFMTVSTVDTSNSDYSTAGSTNDYFKITETGIDTSSSVKQSTAADVMTDYSTSGSTNGYVTIVTESGMDTSSTMELSTIADFVTVSSVETSSSDYSTAGSTNDYVTITESGTDISPAVELYTTTDFVTVSSVETSSSDYSTAGSRNYYVNNDYESGTDTSPAAKWSTVTDVMNDETTTSDDDYIDTYPSLSSTLEYENSTPKFKSEIQDKHETCTSNSCKQSASRMLALVNHTAEPCDDFYSYACGGFVINHFEEFTVNDRVLQTLPDISALDVTVPYKKLYRDFFVSCINYKNGSGLQKVAKFVYDLCVNHLDNLTDFIADIIMLHPQKTLSRLLPLFDVVMEVGPQKKMIPTISLPKFNSLLSEDDDKELYERSCRKLIEMDAVLQKNKTVIQEKYKACIEIEYFKSLQESIKLVQIFGHLPNNRQKQAIASTITFIKDNIIDHFGSISDDELRNAKREIVAINWLNSVYPAIKWNKLFEKLFGADVAKNITEVRMTHVEYLVKIFEFYKSHKFEKIKNTILSMMSVDLNFDFIQPLSANDHYKYCSTAATKLMPDIASMLYLETFNRSDILHAEQKLKLMFDQLVLTFNATLNENIWVNENVRNEVSKKISELNLVTNPYQGFVRFNKHYSKLYGAVSISTDDYISNVITLKQVAKRRTFNTIGESAISPEIIWNHLVWPISSSPIRITETTSIVLPTSLIAPFTSESQKIEEFSTIGFMVAQEISRFLYIDNTSKLFVKENEHFKANMEMHLPDPAYSKNPNIYGILLTKKDIKESQISRFVDNIALHVTFDAYEQYQSPVDKLMPWTDNSISKIFYLLTSQQFCTAKRSSVGVAIDFIRNENLPNYFRINSMMMNSESFLKAFKCQKLDPNYLLQGIVT